MSHFTYIKTSIKNLTYLEKALTQLNINFEKGSEKVNPRLIIPQENNHSIEFCWKNEEYAFVVDKSFWQQRLSITGFLNNITQQYACENVIGESQRTGFQKNDNPQKLSDGSQTVTMERWNANLINSNW